MNKYLCLLSFYLTDDKKDEYEPLGPEVSLHAVGNGTGQINIYIYLYYNHKRPSLTSLCFITNKTADPERITCLFPQ